MQKLILIALLTGFLAWLYLHLTAPSTSPVYVSPEDRILPPATKNGAVDPEAARLAKAITDRNSGIRTYSASIFIVCGKARARGEILLEKPGRFRLKVSSILGQEMDIGSNDTHFWFWSKRM